MIKIGKISYWHVHAWDYTKEAQAHPGTEITAVWDELPERGQEAADKLGVPFYSNLDEMLASDIDAVIVDAPSNIHRDVIIAAARAGKHIFTEKVIAPTLKEVNEVIEAVSANNVKLTVSLPRLNAGYTLAIQDILAQGLLGKVTLVRVRLSHDGATKNWLPEHFYNLEQCGGGALIDLGCHPMYLTRLFLGEQPVEASAQYGYVTGKEVEDNAVVLLKTASGAVGIVEAGFVNAFSPFTIEIHGTQGTLMYGTPDDRLLLRTNLNGEDAAKEWQEQALPDSRPGAFNQFADHIVSNTEAEENVRLAVELTKLVEAANRSVREGKSIRIDELAQ